MTGKNYLPILYEYNAENRSFSALPASPLLLPVLLVTGSVLLWKWFFAASDKPKQVSDHPSGCSLEVYEQSKARYYQLIEKQIWGPGLTDIEQIALTQLQYPRWNKGRLTTYM